MTCNFNYGQIGKLIVATFGNTNTWYLNIVKIYISSGYDVTGWQAQLLAQTITRVYKGNFCSNCSPKNKEMRKN